MRYSFKNEVSHLEKINSLSKEVLINSRFLRNNSMKEIHNNNKIELMKKCYSNYISPKFKENYYDIITCVLPDNKVKSISSYNKDNNSKNLHTNFIFKSFNKNEKIKMKKAILLNMIKIKNKQTKKKELKKTNSTKEIYLNKEISFNFKQNSFLNKFENLKNKCKNINDSSNLAQNNLMHNLKYLNNKTNFKNQNNSSFEDSFYNGLNNIKVKLNSEQKFNEGVLKLKKYNLFKL